MHGHIEVSKPGPGSQLSLSDRLAAHPVVKALKSFPSPRAAPGLLIAQQWV